MTQLIIICEEEMDFYTALVLQDLLRDKTDCQKLNIKWLEIHRVGDDLKNQRLKY